MLGTVVPSKPFIDRKLCLFRNISSSTLLCLIFVFSLTNKTALNKSTLKILLISNFGMPHKAKGSLVSIMCNNG